MNDLMTVYIRPMLLSKRVALTVRPSHTIEHLRGLAAAELNLPPYLIVLVHEGRRLDDGNLLADYLITDGALIRVAIPPPSWSMYTYTNCRH